MTDEHTEGQDPREDLNHVMRARREKLDALQTMGVPAFGYRFDRSHVAADALALPGPVVAPLAGAAALAQEQSRG